MKKKGILLWLFLWCFLSGWYSCSNVLVRNLLGEHIELGLSTSSSVAGNFTMAVTIFDIQQQLKYRDSYSLVSYLDFSHSEQERGFVIDQYLTALFSVVDQSQTFIDQEGARIDSSQAKIWQCEKDIPFLNQDFYAAVDKYDYDLAESLMRKLALARSCIAEETVYLKWYSLYRDTTLSQQKGLMKKLDYLNSNKYDIIKYYELLKPQLLKDLYTISMTFSTNYSGQN